MAAEISHHVSTQQSLEQVFAMAKGDGEDSYSKNSAPQASVTRLPLVNLKLNDALEKVTLPSESGGPVVVADMGSSSGPNTITSVCLIVEKLRTRLPKDAEFQAFFNDLPSNDFNHLFQLLTNHDTRAQNLYVAGVPGSYFDRLFAQSSVHVFYSSLCLHWLSKVPDVVLDKESPAYNRGNPWIIHSPSAVAKAYQQQALLDLKNFLRARAAELVSGGLLFMSFLGRSTADPNEPTGDNWTKFQVIMKEIWSDLVAEGLLTEEQSDTFNIPAYMRNVEDVREALASCGSFFNVLTAEVHAYEFDPKKVWRAIALEPTLLSRNLRVTFQAAVNSLFEAKLGEKLSGVIWQRLEKKMDQLLRTPTYDAHAIDEICIVSLIRK